MSTQELVNIIWQRAELSPISVPEHARWQQALKSLQAKADELDKIKAKEEKPE